MAPTRTLGEVCYCAAITGTADLIRSLICSAVSTPQREWTDDGPAARVRSPRVVACRPWQGRISTVMRGSAVEPHDCAGPAVHDVTMFGSLSRPGEPRPTFNSPEGSALHPRGFAAASNAGASASEKFQQPDGGNIIENDDLARDPATTTVAGKPRRHLLCSDAASPAPILEFFSLEP